MFFEGRWGGSLEPDPPILLIGATRGTGLLIARLLHDAGRPIRILARDPARAARVLGAGPEIVAGDITLESTLGPAFCGASHVIFTAGCRSGRPVGPGQVRRTEYEGVVHALAAAGRAGFVGRFLYMTSSGVGARSFWTTTLNLYKGNTLGWRLRAETAIRASGLPYTIVRTGVLLNAPPRPHAVHLTQRSLPLSPRYRIARADVAAGFVAALDDPRTVRTTFELAWSADQEPPTWADRFAALEPDPPPPGPA